jgi:catechol 2,3-dioxygenase-like lactoylglutathione lyase family enzyme
VSSDGRILTIHHAQIMIPTGGEAAARRFYCDLLGLREIKKPAPLAVRGGLWLEAGDRQLHLGAEPAPAIGGRAHVAYEVAGLAALRTRLAAAGVSTVDGEPVDGYTRCELRDPFGNRVELLERT